METDICAKEACTLCMTCINSCTKNAITIVRDCYGYDYPRIDEEKCIGCGRCKSICNKRHDIRKTMPKQGYAAQMRDKDAIKKSATGGVIQTIAKKIVREGGVCYGAALIHDNGAFAVEHIRAVNMEELERIFNSKYMPSRIGENYKHVRNDLKAGYRVLFSGTPCQVQGLKTYLGKEYDNLLTVDIVCHGVPSEAIFNDYIKAVEKIDRIHITDYIFRDKKITWGSNYCLKYYKVGDKSKKQRWRHHAKEVSSFSTYYLNSDILRENCYHCELSQMERVSDLTCGDFWSIEREAPECIGSGSDDIKIKKGTNCVLANSDKGVKIIESLNEEMVLKKVSCEAIRHSNSHLMGGVKKGNRREEILEEYKNNGYLEIEKRFRKRLGMKMYMYELKNVSKKILPDRLRILLYRILK